MSITKITEMMNTGAGQESKDKRIVTRNYIIETDSIADTSLTLMNNRTIGGITLPRPNDTFPSDTSLKCGNISISRKSEYIWEATCPYEYVGDSNSVIRSVTKPWRLPPYNISISSYSINKAVEKGYKTDDAQGTPTEPIVLPTGDKFDPIPSKPKYYSLLKFTYNIETFKLDWVPLYRDTVNKSSVVVLDMTMAAKTALLQNIGAQRIVVKSDTDNYKYWQVDIEIGISLDGFALELLMAGFHCLDAGKKYEIGIDKTGTIVKREAGDKKIDAVTEPQLIDATSGALLAIGADPQYKSWDIHFAKDWSTLNLPKSMDKAV